MEGGTLHRHQPALLERLFRAIGYAAIGLTGIAVVISVPSAIGFELGWMVIVWALFLLAGLPASVTAWRGRYRGEYVALPFIAGALVIYDIYLWIAAYHEPLNAAAALLVAGFAAAEVTRFVHLHGLISVREVR